MLTCKSPVSVLRAAHEWGVELFKEYAHEFSRHDFTRPRRFACLVLREHQRKSYRGVEALLADCSDPREAVGLCRAPDHDTPYRAFEHLVKPAKMDLALDLVVIEAKARGLDVSGDSVKPAALDGTHLESRHLSRHFERRQRQTAEQDRRRGSGKKKARQPRENAGGGGEVGRRPPPFAGRQATAQAVDRRRHRLPPDPGRPGYHRRGSDHPHFEPLLFDAWRRAGVGVVAADAGHDSEANHRIGRLDMGVRTIIPRRSAAPATSPRPSGSEGSRASGSTARRTRRPTASGGKSRPSTP